MADMTVSDFWGEEEKTKRKPASQPMNVQDFWAEEAPTARRSPYEEPGGPPRPEEPSPLEQYISPASGLRPFIPYAERAAWWVKEHPGELARMGLETAAGIAGTMAVPAAAPYLGLGKAAEAYPLVARMVGAGLGEGLGSLTSQTFNPTETPISDAALTAGMAAAGEGITGKVYDIVTSRKLRTGTREIRKGMKEALEHYDELRTGLRRGPHLFEQEIDDIIETLGKSGEKEDIGKLAKTLLSERFKVWKAVGGAKFRRVEQALPGGTSYAVDTTSTLGEAKRILGELSSADDQARGLVRDVIRDLETSDGSIPWEKAKNLRSKLMEVTRDTTDLNPGEAYRRSRQLSEMLTDDMTVAAKEAGPDALGLWQDARKFWQSGAEKFYETDLLRTILKKEPEKLYQAIVKPNRPGSLRLLRQTLYDPAYLKQAGLDKAAADDLWRNLQSEFLQDILHDAAGDYAPARALNAMRRYGRDTLRELFHGNQNAIDNVRISLRALRILQKEASQSARGQIATVAEGAAAGGLGFAFLHDPATSAALGGTAVLTRLMMTRPFATALMVGATPTASKKAVQTAAGQVAAMMAAEYEKQRRREARAEKAKPPAE